MGDEDRDAVLGIRTVYTPEARLRPYEDASGPDGMLRHTRRGDDRAHAENRALRRVMERGVPLVWFFAAGSVVEEHLRRDVVSRTRRRLHQPVFRSTVMRADATSCAVCSLGHASLRDAAHIVPDADPFGIASVRNGMVCARSTTPPSRLRVVPAARTEQPAAEMLERRYAQFRVAG